MSDLMCTQMSIVCCHDKICVLGIFMSTCFSLDLFPRWSTYYATMLNDELS